MNSKPMIRRRKKIQQKQRAKQDGYPILSNLLLHYANLALSRSSKKLDELLQKTWRMEEAIKVLGREKTSRMEILRKAAEENSSPSIIFQKSRPAL